MLDASLTHAGVMVERLSMGAREESIRGHKCHPVNPQIHTYLKLALISFYRNRSTGSIFVFTPASQPRIECFKIFFSCLFACRHNSLPGDTFFTQTTQWGNMANKPNSNWITNNSDGSEGKYSVYKENLHRLHMLTMASTAKHLDICSFRTAITCTGTSRRSAACIDIPSWRSCRPFSVQQTFACVKWIM